MGTHDAGGSAWNARRTGVRGADQLGGTTAGFRYESHTTQSTIEHVASVVVGRRTHDPAR
ncbi:hypothetical protein BO443_100239 [Burkholderia orbicola]